MLDLFELIPPDVTNVLDVTMRNRWISDGERLRKARELRVKHQDLAETIIPMKWDVEARTWVEDYSANRITYPGLNLNINESNRKKLEDPS